MSYIESFDMDSQYEPFCVSLDQILSYPVNTSTSIDWKEFELENEESKQNLYLNFTMSRSPYGWGIILLEAEDHECAIFACSAKDEYHKFLFYVENSADIIRKPIVVKFVRKRIGHAAPS